MAEYSPSQRYILPPVLKPSGEGHQEEKNSRDRLDQQAGIPSILRRPTALSHILFRKRCVGMSDVGSGGGM
jgi:hypothetical protein